MEESQNQDEDRWGTIFMGPTSDRESTIDKLTDRQQNELWTRRTEAEYMDRVRTKATLRAQMMLDKARSNSDVIRETARQWALKIKSDCEARVAEADMIKEEAFRIKSEAEALRETSREEGYQLGVEQAMMELDEHRSMLDDATASVLQTIGEQSKALFETWREELSDLVRDAVTTATGWILTEERQAILALVLTESLQQIEGRRRLIVRVNAADKDAVDGILRSAQEKDPDLQSWEVIDDETIEAGGLILESESGMVDNRSTHRREAMEQILQHLTLPSGEAEIRSEHAVADVLKRTGMTELAAQAEARAAQDMPALEPQELEALPESDARLQDERDEEEQYTGENELDTDSAQMPLAVQTRADVAGYATLPVESEAHAVAAQAEVASLMQSFQPEDFNAGDLENLDSPPDLSLLTRALPQGAEVLGDERAGNLADEQVTDAGMNDTDLPTSPSEVLLEEEEIPLIEVTVKDVDPSLLEQVPDSELSPDISDSSLMPDMNDTLETNHIPASRA